MDLGRTGDPSEHTAEQWFDQLVWVEPPSLGGGSTKSRVKRQKEGKKKGGKSGFGTRDLQHGSQTL